jgi:phosphohistidine swiveling domain-containing protein
MTPKLVPNLEDITEGLGIPGIAAIVILPLAIPVIAGFGKPLTKTAIKGGILIYEKSRRVIAAAGETFEDIIAEARAEIAEADNKRLEPRLIND